MAQSERVEREFQSTLPTWGETLLFCLWETAGNISIHSPHMGRDLSARPSTTAQYYFNPLSPHGERRKCYQFFQRILEISIHSPHMGRDQEFHEQ